MFNKIIAALLLCASCAFSGEFDKFVAENSVAYAFVELDAATLTNSVEVGQIDSSVVISPAIYDETGTNLLVAAETRQKTISEWLPVQRVTDSGVVVLIAPSQSQYGRITPMGTNDLAEIAPYLSSIGYPPSVWITKDEFMALDFNAGE
jgi:hypothetical protein